VVAIAQHYRLDLQNRARSDRRFDAAGGRREKTALLPDLDVTANTQFRQRSDNIAGQESQQQSNDPIRRASISICRWIDWRSAIFYRAALIFFRSRAPAFVRGF